jgi:hypothetical protein
MSEKKNEDDRKGNHVEKTLWKIQEKHEGKNLPIF